MSKKIKPSKIKKTEKDIELTIGKQKIDKYDIMKAIAKKYSIYGSTVWLNTPIKEAKGKTPAELMLKGEIDLVYKLIQESNGKFDL